MFAVLRRLKPDFGERIIDVLVVAGQDNTPVGNFHDEAREQMKRDRQKDQDRGKKTSKTESDFSHSLASRIIIGSACGFF
jgi:hypothetical protein